MSDRYRDHPDRVRALVEYRYVSTGGDDQYHARRLDRAAWLADT